MTATSLDVYHYIKWESKTAHGSTLLSVDELPGELAAWKLNPDVQMEMATFYVPAGTTFNDVAALVERHEFELRADAALDRVLDEAQRYAEAFP
jgi:hypothetical protein